MKTLLAGLFLMVATQSFALYKGQPRIENDLVNVTCSSETGFFGQVTKKAKTCAKENALKACKEAGYDKCEVVELDAYIATYKTGCMMFCSGKGTGHAVATVRGVNF